MSGDLTDITRMENQGSRDDKHLLEWLTSLVSLAYDSMKKADFERSLDLFERAFKAFPSSLLIQYGIAVSNIYLERYDKAIDILKNILLREKTNPEYWTALGIAYMRKGLFKEAEESFKEADSCSGEKTQTEYNLGSLYHYIGRLEGAKKIFEHCIEANPGFVDAYFGLALVFEDLKDYGSAIKVYEEIIEKGSSLEEAWFNLGVMYTYVNDRKKALECYSKAVEIDPSNTMAWSNMGACYAHLKDFENSTRCFGESLRRDYTIPTAWYNLGTSYCALGSYEKGIMCLEEAVRLNPLHQDAWTNLASAYLDSKDTTKAIEIYKRSLEIDPENGLALKGMLIACIKLIQEQGVKRAETMIGVKISEIQTAYYLFNDIGVELARQRRFEDAICFFKTSTSLKQDFADGWFNLGFTYADLKDNENVIHSYNRYLEIDRGNKHAWNNLGNAYLRTKKTEDALRCYDEALKIDPVFADALANKANCLASLERYSDAIQLCRRATELAPDNPSGWLVYGEVMFLTGQYEEAIKYLSEARKIDPNAFSANAFLGLAFLRTNRFEKSIELLEPINRYGEFSGIIGSAYAMMNNYEEAIRYFESTDLEKTGLKKELVGDLNTYAGLSYLAQGEYGKAIRYLSCAREIKRNNAEILGALGLAFLKMCEFENAAHALGDALEIDPSNESILNNLSYAYWKMEAYDKMESILRKQAEINPRRKQTWDNLGALYLNKSYDFRKAANAFSEAKKLSPNDPKTVLSLAEALTCIGDHVSATKLIQGLLERSQKPKISCLSYFLLIIGEMLENDAKPGRELLSKFLKSYDAMKSSRINVEFSGLYKVLDSSSISYANKRLALSIGDILKGKRDKHTIVTLFEYLLH